MAKNAVSDWSPTPSDNTDIGGISLAEGVMLPSSVNNAIRAMMAQVASAGFIGAASPVLTGNPTAPTPSPGDNDTSIATTAFVTAALASKAPTASPAFTGSPTAPTPTAGDNDTSIATTAFVKTAIAAIPAPPAAGQPIPSTSSYAVGTMALLVNASAGTIADGGTAAGSALRAIVVSTTPAISTTGGPQTGTWKNVSGLAMANNAGGYWVRTA